MISPPTPLEDAVFYTALSITDPAQRGIFLDQACTGNPAMRAGISDLLAAHHEAENFFSKSRSAFFLPGGEPPIESPPPDDSAATVDGDIGTWIGRYKLLQRLGEGGCGVVYMAEQEEPVRRRVALKVIKLGMDTKSVIARFEAERQALALMDHPNIARVMDAGATEAGRPYFVMELVQGIRITEYCDQNRLDLRQRLNLFVPICLAIQHAHQKGVIHRDIKPSNILVTLHDGAPTPKVIDFGIAKATEGRRLVDGTFLTDYGQFIGTPAYMSPEQAEMGSLDVDTRSDVYSLGALFYELLAGVAPFDGKKLAEAGWDEIRRNLREEEPPRPSAVVASLAGPDLEAAATHRHVEPAKLAPLLRGDLDWIVMKALEKDRTRRYQTANGFAVDVQRCLNNEPVSARPPSRSYRLQKLVRRNKGVFIAAGFVAMALIAGMGTSTVLFFRERAALREQAHLRKQAEQSNQRESELRRQAEDREKITQAAILVSQKRFEEAARLLDDVKSPPPRPSFDGVSAFRAVADWLAVQGRWKQAADRFSTLMEIDKLDKWNVVTLDYQACGVVLAESGDAERYARFCKETIASFAQTKNGNAAWRILKASLLMPADPKLLAALSPLAEVAEKSISPQIVDSDINSTVAWASGPLALWKYRCADYDAAVRWCRRCLASREQYEIRNATSRVILAMAVYRLGEMDEARNELAQARVIIDGKFKRGLDRGDNQHGFWWDWISGRILLREATALIEENSPIADSQLPITPPR